MKKRTVAPAAVHYQVAIADLHAHTFRVTLRIERPAPQQTLQLPVWIPGSYLVREFARNLHSLRATQGGRSVPTVQQDKACWRVECREGQPLQVDYVVYAFDSSVRTAWLSHDRGFFNGTSLFLQAVGQAQQPTTVDLLAPPPEQASGWSLATGLAPVQVDRKGFGRYRASDYDELVDCPVEMGPFWSGSFTVAGIPHRFVVAGAPDSFDGKRLLADTRRICEAEIRLWHGAQARRGGSGGAAIPFRHYVFMLCAVHDGYGGLEHRNSTALICTRRDLPRVDSPLQAQAAGKQSDGYTTLLGLISHEYFHTWNVKRLRPAEFARYDYTRENYTELLWFFEGFTSYYDDLLLRRAGLIDNTTYLKLLGKTINQVLQTPGRRVQSVAQASFDAWIKYYRPDENTPNITVSYYTKGALVALCLDLTLRAEGKTTLDAVLRALWQRCQGGPMQEADLLEVLATLAGRSYAQEVARWVHGTAELPLVPLLEKHGVQIHHDPDALAQRLGLRVKEANGLQVQQVLAGGPAQKAGFAAGDEWLAVQVAGAGASGPWRLQSLDDLPLYCGKAGKVQATIVRDRQLLTLPLSVPKAGSTLRLGVKDAAAVDRWLQDAA